MTILKQKRSYFGRVIRSKDSVEMSRLLEEQKEAEGEEDSVRREESSHNWRRRYWAGQTGGRLHIKSPGVVRDLIDSMMAKPELVHIKLCRLDVLHFVIEDCRRLANGCTSKCGWCYFAIYYISGFNNMQYEYYRTCFGTCMHMWRFGCMLYDRPLGDATAHEQKWMSHIKRRSDSARIY